MAATDPVALAQALVREASVTPDASSAAQCSTVMAAGRNSRCSAHNGAAHRSRR